MPDPQNTPPTDPNTPVDPPQNQPNTPPQHTQPDNSSQFWQSKFDSTKYELDQLKQTVQQLQQAQQAPPQQTPQQNQSTDLQFNDITQMYADNGRLKDEYAKAIFSEKLDPKVREQLEATVYQAHNIQTKYVNDKVAGVFGDRTTFDNTYKAAASHLPPDQQQALAAALSNPFLMEDGLKKLKGMAEENGWTNQQQQTTEPPPVQQHTSQPSGSMTPLVPGSAEAKEVLNNPLYRARGPEADAFRKQVDQRLAMGMQGGPDMASLMASR